MQSRVLLDHAGHEIPRTNGEYRLLEYLARNTSQVISRPELLSELGSDMERYVDRTIDVLILTLCAVTLVISAISLLLLRNAVSWLDTIHRDTLSQVSQALELSRNAADLATAAPFLLTVQMPYQRQADANEILQTIEQLEALSNRNDDLSLPLERMRVAIGNLVRTSSPQSRLQAEIAQIETELDRLQDRFQRQANSTQVTVDDRLTWAVLSQLANDARSVTRAQEILEVGEANRRFIQNHASLPDNAIAAEGLRDVEAILTRPATDLSQLKYKSLTTALDAENAHFRIRQLSSDINVYATSRVETAQDRLRVARTQTTQNLELAQIVVAFLAVFSACVAIMSSVFVSQYVTRNLRLIADGMRQLASGDHSVSLPVKRTSDDVIGQLFNAFGVFRSNAHKLDRRTAQITRNYTLLSSVFKGIKDGVAILAPNGTIEAENDQVRAVLHISGAGDAPAQTMQDLFALSTFRHQDSTGERGGYDEYTNPMGDVIEVRSSQLPDGRFVWLLSETTKRKRIEDRLEEIRRVETLGKVTGEGAHDIGDILSTISGNLQLLETADAAATPHRLRRIRTAVDLGVSLTERLVAFVRQTDLEPDWRRAIAAIGRAPAC